MNRKEYEERIAKLEKELDELKKMEIEDDEFSKPKKNVNVIQKFKKHLKRNLKTLSQIGKMAIKINIIFITAMTKIVLRLVGIRGVGKQFYISKVEKY